MIDYNALAQKFGGTQIAKPTPGQGVDYSALAQKFGGQTVTPPTPSVLPKQNQKLKITFGKADKTIPSAVPAFSAKVKSELNTIVPNAIQDAVDPFKEINSAKKTSTSAQTSYDAIKGYEAQKKAILDSGNIDQQKQSEIVKLDNLIKSTALEQGQKAASYATPTSERSINLTPGQIIGDSAQLGLDTGFALEGGAGLSALGKTGVELTAEQIAQNAAKTAAEKALPTSQKIIRGALNIGKEVATSAPQGYAYDVAQNLSDGKKGVDIIKPGAGTAIAAAAPLVLAGGIAGYGALKNIGIKNAQNTTPEIERLAGVISQGKAEDINGAVRSLGSIDASGVKTQADLVDALDGKIRGISQALDQGLDKVTGTKTLDQLSGVVRSGNESVPINHVKDALDQLESLYSKTNDAKSLAEIRSLRSKAESTGLTVKEINELARLHGRDLKAFNANGEAASGLTKQAAENTRSGVKTTARGLFGNKIYEEADNKLHELIRTRDLAQKNADAVQVLKNKIEKRGFGQKVGRALFQISDLLTGQSLGGFVRAAVVPRGAGLKILNALDLEANLARNLKNLQNLISKTDTISEKDFVQELNNIRPRGLYPQLPAPANGASASEITQINLPAPKSPTTFENPAEKIFNQSRIDSVPRLPPGKKNSIPGETLKMPTSVREKNLGLDEVKNAKINQSSNQQRIIQMENTVTKTPDKNPIPETIPPAKNEVNLPSKKVSVRSGSEKAIKLPGSDIINSFQKGKAQIKELSDYLKKKYPDLNHILLEEISDRARAIREGGQSVKDYVDKQIGKLQKRNLPKNK